MTNSSEFTDRKCKTCFYCEKHEVPNFHRDMLYNSQFKELLPETNIFYKCHIQGPPAKVNKEYDWCYQWRLKE